VLELLYGESDLDIGSKTIVEAIHIPMPPKGMYVWGHKVSSDSEHHLVQSKGNSSLAVEMDLSGMARTLGGGLGGVGIT
jgi:hypothetical protein